jgi:hypothetical protein
LASEPKQPISFYLIYDQKDEVLKQEFEDYLTIMQQNSLISNWVERQVQRGTDWSQIINPRILTADLILVSPSLLTSGYCSGAEMLKAFERSEAEDVYVIPIILYYIDLTGYLLETVQSTGRPISS